ncbi:hypothetical protein [Cynomolgus macaque cytomegalovirus strain Mauritius]|uniref:Uncharacterized protein n=1 Tax=Cynomolgus macaque cytomegalovirus strain Mauritius TaxID=1690255 RepID=A0A0K1H072_9BETA|nr:hypothetical protein [Cynomolgus macaque cytomegalovirus strain Mauritius]AXG21782.1 hypothetical protein [synthetic construct]AXG22050.1 hypothetical protein [synthetic construct]
MFNVPIKHNCPTPSLMFNEPRLSIVHRPTRHNLQKRLRHGALGDQIRRFSSTTQVRIEEHVCSGCQSDLVLVLNLLVAPSPPVAQAVQEAGGLTVRCEIFVIRFCLSAFFLIQFLQSQKHLIGLL